MAAGRGLLRFAADRRLALRAPPEVSRDSFVGGAVAPGAPAALLSTASDASGSSVGIGSGQGPDGHRLAAPGHPAARWRIERTDATATGSDHRPRIGAHPPPRDRKS